MQRQLVILMAGNASRLAPLSMTLPKGLLTIKQKPACFNMVADLIANHDVNNITFVTSPTNNQLIKEFVYKSFGGLNDLTLNFVIQDKAQGPLDAFSLCKDYIVEPTLLLLGDTLCETDLDYSYDWVGYQTINDNSHSRWCLIRTDSNEEVQEIIDKPNYTPETNKVLIGLYNFNDVELIKQCMETKYPKIRNEYQLSSFITEYNKHKKVKGLLIKDWYDTGTLKDYNQTLAKNIKGRSFNKFTLDEFGVLTKQSSYQKLKSEINWIKSINDKGLGYLLPNFFGSEITNKNGEEIVSYKIEYINGHTLSEYYNYYKINQANWKYIFERLIKTMKALWSNKAPKSFDINKNCKYMYIDKTLQRIKEWERQDILEQEYIYANGEKLLGFKPLFEKLMPKIEKLVSSANDYAGIIHGDSCFSNIMFFPNTGTFKLLDPRGNFGEDTIYGDIRYDVAKIRHNYHGLYDNIVLSMFKFKEISNNDFEYTFFSNDIIPPEIFDVILQNSGFNLNEIELIEGLLFISMIPLHADNKNAQILFYITGLKCLNHQLSLMGE